MENLFSHVFPATIWRILPHPSARCNQWAVELRDANAKVASLALIDLDAPTLCWESTPEGTDWWTTLTAFHESGTLLLHNYRYPDLPEPTDLVAVSAESGGLRWMLPNYLYVCTLDDQRIEVATRQGEQVRATSCRVADGTLEGTGSSLEVPCKPQPTTFWQIPVRYRPRDIYFDTLSAFLHKIAKVKQPLLIDYLECNSYIAFSYYLYEQEQIAQYLLIVNQQSEVVHHEQLTKDRSGVGQDTLLRKGDTLVYLRHTNEFASIQLTPL
ncbi:hypothetical protein GCM10027275_09410 [Rhabdobacter roseus]|uniref:DUF4905 domain-containing protein n=1 Tax=Rhabdobacter roseus TaxID=1655419 RepID=A0A840TMS4_9BACT|nr:DUF4905 domain-containing protein [Rhabdobacter roseus]MBB5282842.1 hypothetical protein [Rhabdobacter roseus]